MTASRKPRARGFLLRALLSAGLVLALGAGPERPAAQTQSGRAGIGGTGHAPDGGNGIGGTGDPARSGNGIGGTGIIGTITGFGSILVNGYEIDYAPDIPVASTEGAKLKANDLRIGQVVEVVADGEGQHVKASGITVRHELAGPIQSVDQEAGTLTVLGQVVAADKGIIAIGPDATPHSLAELRAGDHVAVSGFRREDGVIVASRLDTLGARRSAVLRGTVTQASEAGFTVGGVHISAGQGYAVPPVGAEVTVIGTAARDGLQARRIVAVPDTLFARPVQRLSIEGYIGRRRGDTLAVGGVALGPGRSGLEMRAGDRVIVNGRFDASRRLLPEDVRPSRGEWRRGGAVHRGGPRGGMRRFFEPGGEHILPRDRGLSPRNEFRDEDGRRRGGPWWRRRPRRPQRVPEGAR